MHIDEIIERLPKTSNVIGESWLQRKKLWAEDYIGSRIVWYEQLEKDIGILLAWVDTDRLIKCYRPLLRDKKNIWATLYEIHGAALIASISTEFELHAPRGDSSGKNFDVRANIRGNLINAECKTRKDDFPFNLPPTLEGPKKIPLYSGSRATLDPHDARELGMGSDPLSSDALFKPIPESTEVRRILLDGLSQLPEQGCNLILFGQLSGTQDDLDAALLGTEVVTFHTDIRSRDSTGRWSRLPTGAFGTGPEGEPFRQLSGVLWFKLGSFSGRDYAFYANPRAIAPLPAEVSEALETAVTEWKNSG